MKLMVEIYVSNLTLLAVMLGMVAIFLGNPCLSIIVQHVSLLEFWVVYCFTCGF